MPSVGETLQFAREDRALSIDQVARDTRISARFLEALEADNYEALPAPVYVRGFLRSYASYLRLDPAPLLNELASSGALAEQGFGDARTSAATRTIPPPPGRPRTLSPFEDNERSAAADDPERTRVDPFRRPPAIPREAARTTEIGPGGRQAPQRQYEPAVTETRAPMRAPGRPVPVPPIPPDVLAVEDDEPYARRRRAAVLDEPPDDDEQAGSGRVLAIAAGGLLVLVAALGLAVLITRGGGGDDDRPPAAALATATATVGKGTVVVVGSPTGAATASPTVVASVTPDPNATPTATPGPGTPTATPTVQPLPTATTRPNVTPGATATPTDTPAPSATATPPPATNTPVPPTPRPTPTAVIPHPSRFQECTNNDCGQPPLRVICPPDGDWFIDKGSNFAKPPDWRETTVTRPLDAEGACG